MSPQSRLSPGNHLMALAPGIVGLLLAPGVATAQRHRKACWASRVRPGGRQQMATADQRLVFAAASFSSGAVSGEDVVQAVIFLPTLVSEVALHRRSRPRSSSLPDRSSSHVTIETSAGDDALKRNRRVRVQKGITACTTSSPGHRAEEKEAQQRQRR